MICTRVVLGSSGEFPKKEGREEAKVNQEDGFITTVLLNGMHR